MVTRLSLRVALGSVRVSRRTEGNTREPADKVRLADQLTFPRTVYRRPWDLELFSVLFLTTTFMMRCNMPR